MKALSLATILVAMLGTGCATDEVVVPRQAFPENKIQSGDLSGVGKPEPVSSAEKPKTTATVKSTKTYQSKGKPVE